MFSNYIYMHKRWEHLPQVSPRRNEGVNIHAIGQKENKKMIVNKNLSQVSLLEFLQKSL